MLVVDINALVAIDPLHFLGQVGLHGFCPLDPEEIMRIDGTLRQGVAGLYSLAMASSQSGAKGDGVNMGLAVGGLDFHFPFGPMFIQMDDAINFGNDSLAFRLAGFKQFFHPGQTQGDVITGNAAGMEGPHGQLGARFAN